MKEKSFVERYEELVQENASLKARLVLMDKLAEEGQGPLRRIHLIGDYAKVFTAEVQLSLEDMRYMSAREGKLFAQLEAAKTLGAQLFFNAAQDGCIEIAPRLSDNVFEARCAMVKLK